MEFRFLIVVPALISLIVKACVLYTSRNSLSKNNFTTLLTICALQSLCEVVTFFSYMDGGDVESLFRIYYVCLIWWLCYAFIYTADIIDLNNRIKTAMLIVAASFTVILFVTDLIISGYYSIGYSITAHREQYYFAYQAYVIGLIIVSLILLIKTYLSSSDKTLKAQCFYLSLGFLAPFLTIFTVTILMQLGYKINMLMLLPISTAIFVIFVVKCENEHKLIDMKRLLPWSKENKFSAQVNLIANRFAESELDLKAANKEFERLLLLHCKNKGYSKRRSAKLLGIGTSTLYYKLEKFEIDWKD